MQGVASLHKGERQETASAAAVTDVCSNVMYITIEHRQKLLPDSYSWWLDKDKKSLFDDTGDASGEKPAFNPHLMSLVREQSTAEESGHVPLNMARQGQKGHLSARAWANVHLC